MNAIKIMAERSGKGGVIIVQKYPLNSGMTHRYVVKRVDLEYFTGETACLDYCREEYGLTWVPSWERQETP